MVKETRNPERIFPFLAVFAVANTALLNMLMASRLIDGMVRHGVLPRPLEKVLPGAERRGPVSRSRLSSHWG